MIVKYVKLLIIIGLLIGFYPHTSFAQNTDLRGQVVAYNPYSRSFTPVPNVKVELYKYDNNRRSWNRVFTTYTDSYGMYYMYRISLGNYYLQVKRVNYPLKVIFVDRNKHRFQDVSRIQLK